MASVMLPFVTIRRSDNWLIVSPSGGRAICASTSNWAVLRPCSLGALAAGLDDRYPMTSAEPGARFPAGPAHQSFLERFAAAYRAEMTEFVQVAAGAVPSRCTVADALEAFRVAEACGISRREGRPVALAEIPGA